jgi:hypothetical protein
LGTLKTLDELFSLEGGKKPTGNAVEADVLSGKTFSNASGIDKVGSMPNQGAVVITPNTINQTIAQGYHNGAGYVMGDADLVTGNIRAGVDIFGVIGKSSVVDTADAVAIAGEILSGKTAYVNGSKLTGSMPNKGAVNITPSTTNQQIAAGYHNGSGVVYGDPDLVAGNIKNGVNIFGVVGSFKGVLTQAQSSGTTPQSTTTQLFRIDGTGVAGSLSYSGWNLNNNDSVILSIVCDGVVAASSPPLYRGASGLLECFKYFESNSWVNVTVYGYVDVFDCVFTVRKL